jgi:aldehyde:ferredoxin oxidoreductase
MSAFLPELGYEKPFPGRTVEGKARWVIHLQHLMTLLDSLSLCKFSILNNAVRLSVMKDWFGLVTGRDVTIEDILLSGERAFTLKRIINNQRGITRKDDLLPPRMRTLKKRGEGFDFEVPPLFSLLSEYYDLRGWTEEGRPGRETLFRLGLEDFGLRTGPSAPVSG